MNYSLPWVAETSSRTVDLLHFFLLWTFDCNVKIAHKNDMFTFQRLHWFISPCYTIHTIIGIQRVISKKIKIAEKKIEEWFARDILSTFFHAFEKWRDHRVRHYLSCSENTFLKFIEFNGFLDSFRVNKKIKNSQTCESIFRHFK